MERSVGNIKEMLRENVARFLEHADGREVIVNVTARLVKKQSEEQEKMKKDEHSKRNSTKYADNTSSQFSKSATVCSESSNSGLVW
ncbi:unnamed protein product [Litomosoides sigmodontis]|uniref:Uncharacterized protein n=1 Tax=Litomosoides sigmodontis TaxID=42156 RepID=A0A3P6U787_LITSI|nr:unnamed protein product [Litomosoides sigmodontis]